MARRGAPGNPPRLTGPRMRASKRMPHDPGHRNFKTSVKRQPSYKTFANMHQTGSVRGGRGRMRHQTPMRGLDGRFMQGGSGMAWQGLDASVAALGVFGDRVRQSAAEALGTIGQAMEDYAKQNRPWEDQTGNARNGLHHVLDTGGEVMTVWLGHGVWYGIWLETSRGGRYAILLPTLRRFAPLLSAQIRGRV